MKDMKSMKGWFAVNPDVSSYSKAIQFLTQRRRGRREISFGDGLSAQWSRHCSICVDQCSSVADLHFQAKLPSFTLRSLAALREIFCFDFSQRL
jgi:hypothetical protein